MEDSAFAQEWAKTRQQGFGRFVVGHGVGWGISVTVAVLVGEWFDGVSFSPTRSLCGLAAFVAIGCIVAPLVWHKREDRYRYFIERSEP